METVNELRKLLDIDLESLAAKDEHNLSGINRNSDRLSRTLGAALDVNVDQYKSTIEPKARVRFRLDDKLSQHQNAVVKIVRDDPKPSRTVKRTFLRKGDGLKRFGLPKTNCKQSTIDRIERQDRIECYNKSTAVDQGTDPIDAQSSSIDNESEDSFIAETNEQIRMLEHRIERLFRLKDALIEMSDDTQDLADKLAMVQKNLDDFNNKNNKFFTNQNQDLAEHYPNGALRIIQPDQTIMVKFAK
ncbi:hypothetical protein BLA29_000932 [Euroglyphus maynei]|uniref:Uncharacterized protein n=1 Tax=Euroglyphus maynei TaxID=6958 RepID=A0A1Y3AM08_EURMA|nr:hypothetical protein BLA29_000932 [Euroglyphus maynei]